MVPYIDKFYYIKTIPTSIFKMVLKCKHGLRTGTIYIQIFPHGKKYVGQTVSKSTRFCQYVNEEGNNPHHTNALKKHGYKNVQVLTFDVPEFLLDAVEISLIALYDTTDREKGYNKMTGGHNGRPNEETKEKLRLIQSDGRHKGPNNAMYGKKHKPETIEIFKKINTGNGNPMFGRQPTKEFIENARKKGPDHHMFGKKATEEAKKKMSISRTESKRPQETKVKMSKAKLGEKHPRATAVYAFGNWYGSCGRASDALRFMFNRKDNFIKAFVRAKKHTEIFLAG
ncbi:GIY-YIG catalytic domain-containing endonuclease [Acanthocystis turfacea Chlorella virus WI0606]|nr:GIY-YIG catalytic domain-containing endonuclease [Acanthocystis turfacea Chlorella virus WI0606]